MQAQLSRTAEITEVQSQTYVRNMLRAGLSCILYLRGIFEEDQFVDKNLCGLNIKALVPRDSNAQTITQWVEKGVFDALQKRYLKTIIFSVYADSSDENTLIESYNFSISYSSSSDIDIDISKGDKPSKRFSSIDSARVSKIPTKDEIKSATSNLIRRLLSLTQTLEPLPKERHLVMKLLYYPESTPLEYSPPFFRTQLLPHERGSWSDSLAWESSFSNSPYECLKIGNVSTPFHSLSCSVLSSNNIIAPSYSNFMDSDHREPLERDTPSLLQNGRWRINSSIATTSDATDESQHLASQSSVSSSYSGLGESHKYATPKFRY